MRYEIEGQLLTNIANAIRTKTGKSALITPEDMPEEISSISGAIGDIALFSTGETARVTPPITSVKDSWGIFEYPNIVSIELVSLQTVPFGSALAQSQSITTISLPSLTSMYGDFTSCTSLTHISAPLCQEILGQSFSGTPLEYAYFPSCTHIGYSSFSDCTSLEYAYFPSCTTFETVEFSGADLSHAFSNCTSLQTAEFNSACDFPSSVLHSVIQPQEKTFRLYLRGTAIGTCSENAFGVYSSLERETASSDGSGCGCGSGCGGDSGEGPIAGLEIYVPTGLLTQFKTTWANGAFADNIYPLPDEDE